MKDIFIIVSENPAGAHVVQNIIEEAETKNEKDIIMGYVKGKEMEMALHEEGTHVLQKLIQVFLEKERQDLTDVLCTQKNVEKMCQDLKGISVIKRLISFNKEIENRIKLVESFYPNMPIISKSSSGAYIVNYLLEQLKVYEEREKAFQTHLKMKDIEIQNLEKEIKKLRGDSSQINPEENEAEEDSDLSNEDQSYIMLLFG